MSLLGSVWKFTTSLVPVFSQVHFCLFSSLLLFFLPDFLTIGRCEKYLSKSVIKISESCSPPLPYAAAKKLRKLGFSYSKAYKSKTNPLFEGFFYIPTGETFLYIIFKNQCCIFILSFFFCGETETRHTSCASTPYDTVKR